MSSETSLVDTDMQLHRKLGDPAVRNASESFCQERAPLAACEFSLVEFKGSYIQDLILLRSKISRSDSIGETMHRILNSSDRKRCRMLAHFAEVVEIDFSDEWSSVKNRLITALDGQIAVAWESFSSGLEEVTRSFRCTRATEPPQAGKKGWECVIPKCLPRNTSCTIADFMASQGRLLEELQAKLEALRAEDRTAELSRIQSVVTKTLARKSYDWRGTTCRSIGDLLIALQSLNHRMLITSNAREHLVLSSTLGNTVEFFSVGKYRLK